MELNMTHTEQKWMECESKNTIIKGKDFLMKNIALHVSFTRKTGEYQRDLNRSLGIQLYTQQ